MTTIITGLFVLCELEIFGKETVFIIETVYAYSEVQAKAEEAMKHGTCNIK
jgi:hypothetical protein